MIPPLLVKVWVVKSGYFVGPLSVRIFALFYSEIINPLFDGLTYNTCGHFTTQLAKYPRVLDV